MLLVLLRTWGSGALPPTTNKQKRSWKKNLTKAFFHLFSSDKHCKELRNINLEKLFLNLFLSHKQREENNIDLVDHPIFFFPHLHSGLLYGPKYQTNQDLA